ncbi:iron ABC transporter permease [Pseudomonas chengduensis]|mgnify:FL=1|jgi:iron complex transport system permease protein|uniref:Iron complex transport system permease protein n=1 Tax=Pseudomonas sihuiensis TaxID=1274359 RepID=A0A1H2LH34_9PSED|nr:MULTISPECIES: iron ABC transporter permease [Pseudomonas]MAE23402.1 iron ABC transporter permease [Pseudomonas sp.]MDH0625209.1 iron ABC transporter permease [Pseudomonas chengduensis]MDH1665115.1 iron ABC transporter permease [Pseudomonas chengduensis]TRO44766.1 iron ABC transporter permease [Pseudomonas sp. ALS1279]SDU80373.1 iron complex transport system permease protein [Pseudomonas sihuiensis]|tara:strand:+ start:106 stop:1107 length:1002 start_codon:yes stop_codon:yes gene_type:complete
MLAARLSVPQALSYAALCLLLLCVASLLLGAGDIGILPSLQALLGGSDDDARFIVFELRWVRTELALLVGLALGAAGVLLQAVTRNPLAEPGLLGVSAGASFAVVLAINLGASAASMHLGVAMLGALVGCVLVLLVTRMRGVGDDPVRLVLAGAAFSGILGALSSLLLLWDQRTADEMRFWVIGALAGRPLDTLDWSLPGLLGGLLMALLVVRPLAALALGERVASGLGHHPQLTRLGTLLAVAILVGTATAAAGPIAFIGLIVPYIARRLVGSDIRRTLGLSMLLGPCVLLLADVISRLLVRPYELPVGVVTAFVGAPILIAVVRNHRLPTL